MLGAGYFGTGYFGAGYFGGASGAIIVPPETEVEEPIYAIAALPVAAPDEPVLSESEDLLRLNTSAVIDLAYLVELKPFAPAGASLPG